MPLTVQAQGDGELAKTPSQDSIKDLDDFSNMTEELLELFGEKKVQGEDDDKKQAKKKEKSDTLAAPEKIFNFLESNQVKIQEAMKALAGAGAAPGLPKLPVPKMIAQLKGTLDGPDGAGNPWLAKSMMTDLICLLLDILPILARIKMEETKNEAKATKSQHQFVTAQAKSQIKKAKLEADKLKLDALKQFIAAGITAGVMIGMMAMSTASAVKSIAKNVGGTVAGKAVSLVKTGISQAKGAAQTMKGMAGGKGGGGDDGADAGGAIGEGGGEGLGDTDGDFGKTGTSSSGIGGKSAVPGGGPQLAKGTSAMDGGDAVEDAGGATGGAGGDEEGAATAGAGGGKSSGQAGASKNATKLNAGPSFSQKSMQSYQSREMNSKMMEQMGKMAEQISGGIIDTLKSVIQGKIGYEEANITMYGNLVQLMTKAREASREEIRSAADAITKVFEMMQKLIDAQQAFRITR